MQTRNLIDGQWVGGEGLDVFDPATDEHIASVPAAGRDEAHAAIDAAATAFQPWSTRPAHERAALLHSLAALMLRDQDRLASLLTAEQGKPLAEARAEIAYAASFIEHAAGEAVRVQGQTIPASTPDKRLLALRQPIGVVAAITPWNFPSAMITRKVGPALAAGCSVVVKPAEQTPLSALALGQLILDAGFPPGVVNIITGDPEQIGAEMLANPIVRKLSFTGSTEVGKLLIKRSAENVTRLSLELGGHAPFIVFDDADINAAIAGALATKHRNAGQTCICANRFYIHRNVYDEFAARLTDASKALRVGRGTDDDAQIGPLIDDHAIAKVEAHVADALDRGATLRCGGTRHRIEGLADRFYQPTVIDNFNHDMLLAKEETFGPVAPLMPFDHERQAVELANDSPYGLAAYFYTRDTARAWRVAEQLEYGVVGVNDATPSTAQAPFGGVKQSGFGREGGHWGLNEYTYVKYLSIGALERLR